MKVIVETLGSWISMPIRYDEEEKLFYVMFDEERIEADDYHKLLGILSVRTLNGDFSTMEAEQKERMRRKKERREA